MYFFSGFHHILCGDTLIEVRSMAAGTPLKNFLEDSPCLSGWLLDLWSVGCQQKHAFKSCQVSNTLSWIHRQDPDMGGSQCQPSHVLGPRTFALGGGQIERLVDWRSRIYSAILMCFGCKTAGVETNFSANAWLLRVYGHMVVKHGFFQSDPHNGNWLLDCKGGSLCEIRLGRSNELLKYETFWYKNMCRYTVSVYVDTYHSFYTHISQRRAYKWRNLGLKVHSWITRAILPFETSRSICP